MPLTLAPPPTLNIAQALSPVSTIFAYKDHPDVTAPFRGCYHYDDRFVFAEPLVHSATEVIDSLFTLRSIPAPWEVCLEFAKEFPGEWTFGSPRDPILILNLLDTDISKEGKSVGHTYACSPIPLQGNLAALWRQAKQERKTTGEAWLCEHLLDYFEEPPQEFFVKISRLR
jgi:hypothetical protein